MNTRARVIAEGSPWAARRINPAASRDRCCAKTINSRTPAARRQLLIGCVSNHRTNHKKANDTFVESDRHACLGKSRRTRHCYRWRSTAHYHRPFRIETGCAFSREFRHRAAEWIAAFAGRLAGRPGVGCTKLDRCGDELAKVADVAENQFGSSKLGENASAHLRGKCRRLQVHQAATPQLRAYFAPAGMESRRKLESFAAEHRPPSKRWRSSTLRVSRGKTRKVIPRGAGADKGAKFFVFTAVLRSPLKAKNAPIMDCAVPALIRAYSRNESVPTMVWCSIRTRPSLPSWSSCWWNSASNAACLKRRSLRERG